VRGLPLQGIEGRARPQLGYAVLTCILIYTRFFFSNFPSPGTDNQFSVGDKTRQTNARGLL
jgi:hypothetical protein